MLTWQIPSATFKNYLLKIVNQSQGLLRYSDFYKLSDSSVNLSDTISGLAKILQKIPYHQFERKLQLALAHKLYVSWTTLVKEQKLAQVIQNSQKDIKKRQLAALYAWKAQSEKIAWQQQLQKLKQYISKILKENKELRQGGAPKKVQVANTNQSSKQNSSSRTAHQSPHSEKLYYDAFRKVKLQELRKKQLEQKELEGCTFHPKTHSQSSPKLDVYTRLTSQNLKIRDQLRQLQKDKQDLKGCTFTPSILSQDQRSQSFMSNSSSQRLYDDAENYRANLRKRVLEKVDNGLDECTFKPTINCSSKRKNQSKSVFDELYKDSILLRKKQQESEVQQQQSFEKTFKFQPNLEKRTRSPSEDSVYNRLYNQSFSSKNSEVAGKRSYSVPKKNHKSSQEQPVHGNTQSRQKYTPLRNRMQNNVFNRKN